MASVKTHETTYGSIAHCRDGEETDRVSRKKNTYRVAHKSKPLPTYQKAKSRIPLI